MPVAIKVMPWPDPVLDTLGHDPRSWYAETFWLPTLGPTALLLMRHLADRFERQPGGVELPVAATAAALGLGPRDGQSSPLIRSLARLQQFELACAENETSIAVRRSLPPIHRRHVRRLPTALQAEHEAWTAAQHAKPVDIARRRARRFALTLVMQGEPLDNVERALHTGGFHPALAYEAVRWARDRRQELDDDADPTPAGSNVAVDQAPLPAVVPRR